MYRLDPAPPKLPAQEYIVRYLTEKEEKYLAWYEAEILCRTEPAGIQQSFLLA